MNARVTDAPKPLDINQTFLDVQAEEEVVVLTTPKTPPPVHSTALFGADVMERVLAAVAEQSNDIRATFLDPPSPEEEANGAPIILLPKAESPEDLTPPAALPDEDIHTLSRPDDAPSTPLQTFEELDIPPESSGEYSPSTRSDLNASEAPSPPAEASADFLPQAEASADKAPSSQEIPVARMMVSGDYLAADASLRGGAGATSMYIPTSAVLEAVEALEQSQADLASATPPDGTPALVVEQQAAKAHGESYGEGHEEGHEEGHGESHEESHGEGHGEIDEDANQSADESALGGQVDALVSDALPGPEAEPTPEELVSTSEPDDTGMERVGMDDEQDDTAVSRSDTADVPALYADDSSDTAPVSIDKEALIARMKDQRPRLGATMIFGMELDALPGVSTPEGGSTDLPGVRETQRVGFFETGAMEQTGVDQTPEAKLSEASELSHPAEESIPEDVGQDLGEFLLEAEETSPFVSSSQAAMENVGSRTDTFQVSAPETPEDAGASSPYLDSQDAGGGRSQRLLMQTSVIDDVAVKMAEVARMAQEKQTTRQARLAEGPSLSKTMAMEAVDIQQWASDLGVDLSSEESDKIEDATERVAQAELAADEGRFAEAIELYLSLLRAFPSDVGYQKRLEHVWTLMREQGPGSLELPSVPVGTPGDVSSETLSWSGKQPKSLPLYWGGGAVLLLIAVLVLGLVWPGWFRGNRSTDGPSVRYAASPALSSMQINSTPPGASIILDGKDTGMKTPMSLQRKPGTYALALRLEGYRPLQKSIELKSGMAFAIEFAMAPAEVIAEPDSGAAPDEPPPVAVSQKRATVVRRKRLTHTFLKLRTTPPGASISIDDKRVGRTTPTTLKLATGRYQLQLQLEGFQTYIRDISLTRARQRMSVRLVRATSRTRLSITTKPPGATITLDGKVSDQVTPAILTVSTAELVLTLSMKGYQAINRKLSLKPGETRRLNVTLTRRGPAGMVYVRGGPFWMGNNAGIPREKPMRQVQMRGFLIDKNEVTVEQYQACVKAGRCKKAGRKTGCNAPDPRRANHPINCVSWHQAAAYCRWQKKRLPTEAEWEKAARGATPRMYPWGHNSPSCGLAIFGQRCSSLGTQPVGSRKRGRSPYGAHDMAGNVWEWVYDFFDRKFYQKASDRNPINRIRGTGYRVIRGGAWNTSPDQIHATYRLEYWPSRNSNSIGFRCAR